MEALRHAAELAKSGRGQIVARWRSRGVGKSRLFYEFKATSQTGSMVLETVSVSFGKASAFLPVIDLLHGYFDVKSEDDSRKRREKVTGRVLALDRSLEDTLSYLFGLLGIVEGDDPIAQMDAQLKKRRTLDAIKRILLRESLNQPLMVEFEDLHWIDDETQAFLNLLADSIGTAKILLLVNYRPEYSHQWNSKTYYTQLRLDPLGRESAEEMLSSLVGDGRDLIPLKRLIIEKTEGNPFFMEEMVEVLVDEGALIRNGRFKLTKSLSQLEIPPTVQAILASRIDRLPPDEKDLLQTLAAIGREFALGLLQKVVGGSDDELNRMLHDLQLAEFIYEQPSAGDVEYTFKHALTQEVAYKSVLIERRKLLHERIAQGIEALFASRLEDHYNELAHHYSRSRNTRRALDYLRQAGEQAAHRSANAEEIEYFTAALELLEALPDTLERAEQELVLHLDMGPSLQSTKGYAAPEVERLYTHALELCRQVGETPRLFPTLIGLQAVYLIRGELQTALELGERCLNLARQAQDIALLLTAHHALTCTRVYLGDLIAAHDDAQRVIALYDPNKHHRLVYLYGGDDPAVCCLSHDAWALWSLGYPEQAMQNVRKALALARKLSHPLSLALALTFAASLQQFGERRVERAQTEALLALASEQGFAIYLAAGSLLQAQASFEQGQGKEGIDRIRHALAAIDATGTGIMLQPSFLAAALGRKGRFDEALRTINELFPIIERSGQRYFEAEVHRLKGELLLAQDASNAAQAEDSFRTAIEISRKQNAKSWELRATTSLARLLAKQGKRDEAGAMLAEIYGWFTEGFDTADLKDAKALLEELSA